MIGRLGGVALDGIGSADLEMRECTDGFVSYNSTVVEDFLELGGCLFALMCGQIRFCFGLVLDGHCFGIDRLLSSDAL